MNAVLKSVTFKKVKPAIIYILMAAALFSFIGYSLISLSHSFQEGNASNFIHRENKDFKNFIFTSGYNTKYPKSFFTNYLPQITKDLNFTGVHYYANEDNNNGYLGEFGVLLNPLQIKRVNSIYDSVRKYNLPILSGRINIENMMYGQRLVYEAEGNNDKTYNYGFSYQTVRGKIESDSGSIVVSACTSEKCDKTPRYLAENIYENLQHGDMFDFVQEDAGNWYIKPRMRIPVGNSPELPVVRINAVNFKGDTINSFVIKVKDFGNNYKGEYLEKYVNDFVISGRYDDKSGLNYGINNLKENDSKAWEEKCRVDFKIWWYGLVDVWIDKIIVDDNRSNKLFNGEYNSAIQQEAELFGNRKENYAFYSDEIVYANLDCIKKIQDIVSSVSGKSEIHTATSNYHNTRGLKNDTLGFRAMFLKVKFKSFSIDAHEIPWELPNSLEYISSLPQAKFISTEKYNQILQLKFGDKKDRGEVGSAGSLIYQIENARKGRNLYSPQTEFITQPQMHAWIFEDKLTAENTRIWGLREPINEEIQAQAMLSIAHGTEGLCWFLFQYHNSKPFVNGEERRFWGGYGLLDSISTDEYSPRIKNFYDENKYEYIGEMNKKILVWKSVLDNTDFAGGYSVHIEGPKHHFISDIKSIYRDFQTLKYSNLEDDVKYWEMGFFEGLPSDSSKYFMMVNRRCVPESSPGVGDYRQLRIKFNLTDQIEKYQYWRLIDVFTGKEIFKINKSMDAYYNLGEFTPGEGKLFKLELI